MITRRALFLLLLAAPILALGTITTTAVVAAGIYLLAVLAILGVDIALSPSPGDFRLTRENEAKLSLGADNRVTITVRRLGTPGASGARARPVKFLARDEPPPEYQAEQSLHERGNRAGRAGRARLHC